MRVLSRECLVRLHERDAGHLDEAAGAHVVQLPGAGRVFEKGVEGAPPGPQREHPLDGVLGLIHQPRFHLRQLRVVVAAQRLVGRDGHGERRRSGLLLLEYGVLQFGQVIAGRDESHDVEPVPGADGHAPQRLNEKPAGSVVDEDRAVGSPKRGDALDSDAVSHDRCRA